MFAPTRCSIALLTCCLLTRCSKCFLLRTLRTSSSICLPSVASTIFILYYCVLGHSYVAVAAPRPASSHRSLFCNSPLLIRAAIASTIPSSRPTVEPPRPVLHCASLTRTAAIKPSPCSMPSSNPPARHARASLNVNVRFQTLRRTCVGAWPRPSPIASELRPTSRRDSRACRWRCPLPHCAATLQHQARDSRTGSRELESPCLPGLRCSKASVGFALLAEEASAILLDYVTALLFLFVSSLLSTLRYRVRHDGQSHGQPTKRHFRTSPRLKRKNANNTMYNK
ncbi:hypothetical protein GGI35DRAFT_441287 [Trichoderma velutinum]